MIYTFNKCIKITKYPEGFVTQWCGLTSCFILKCITLLISGQITCVSCLIVCLFTLPFFPPSGVIFNFSETSSFYSVPFLLASCLLIQLLLISRICLKTRHEKGHPLQPICYCIKTWNLSMKTGQVHDGALTDWKISCTRRKNASREHLFFLHYVKIKVEKWNYRLISVLAPTCVMVHHTATHHQLVALHGNYTVSNILRVPCRRQLFTKKQTTKTFDYNHWQ